MLNVRLLRQNDWVAFRLLRLQGLAEAPDAFGSTLAEEQGLPEAVWTARLEQEDSAVFGAFAGDELVGIAGLGRQRHVRLRHKGEVRAMYVAPAHRRQGAARALLTALVDQARSEGIEQLTLSVVAHNAAARRLYESLGFRAYGVEPHALKLAPGEYLDEEHMVLLLT